MTTTRPFHADGPWELRWDAGGFFQATLEKVGGEEDTVANQLQPGQGSSYVPTAGDYYVKFVAMSHWTAKAVALAPGTAPETADVAKPSDLDEDQSGLPPCDDLNASEEVKQLVENSPLGRTTHLQVLDVGPVTKTTSPKGAVICHTRIVTTGGEMNFDFQSVRRNGKEFVTGQVKP